MSTARRPLQVREARAADAEAMLAMMPRLASFDLPPGRNPEDLWSHDAALLKRWAAGDAPDCLVHVAVTRDDRIVGLVMTSLRPELLSHEPSAHIEAITVLPEAEGAGLGRALMDATEAASRARGARSITLHVFARNERARRLYARCGYDEELIRCSKPLG